LEIDVLDDGVFEQRNRQSNFGAKLIVQFAEFRVSQQNRVYPFMKSVTLLLLSWNRFGRKVLLHEVRPLGRLFIAPIETSIDGKAHSTAHIVTGDQIVGERITVLAMIVVAIHIFEQTAHMFTKRVINDQDRVSRLKPMRSRGFHHVLDTTFVDLLLLPWCL
jgi:hypothetical protein